MLPFNMFTVYNGIRHSRTGIITLDLSLPKFKLLKLKNLLKNLLITLKILPLKLRSNVFSGYSQ